WHFGFHAPGKHLKGIERRHNNVSTRIVGRARGAHNAADGLTERQLCKRIGEIDEYSKALDVDAFGNHRDRNNPALIGIPKGLDLGLGVRDMAVDQNWPIALYELQQLCHVLSHGYIGCDDETACFRHAVTKFCKLRSSPIDHRSLISPEEGCAIGLILRG